MEVELDSSVTLNTLAIERIMQRVWKKDSNDNDVKINKDALSMSTEFIRLFVVEAGMRSAAMARSEGASIVDAKHLEKVLPKLLMDFC